MPSAPVINANQFTDILIRRTPHYDKDILKDITPVRGWIGQVPTGSWGAFEGVSKIGHRIRRMFPDLSGCWTDVTATGCVGQPCDPTRKKVGFGSDQFTYNLEEIYFETDIFCFPLVMSADAAKEQFAALISGLREATVWIWNHRYRMEAVRLCEYQVLAGAAGFPRSATPVWNDDCTVMTTAGEPTSTITIQYLQRWVDILTLRGYMGENPMPMKNFFEFITDAITSTKLVDENPNLKDYVTGLTPQEFANLYKYGITRTIGNFAIHPDPTPLRYTRVQANTFNAVFPYENQPATLGIGADLNWAYLEAGYQWDFIWHRSVMRSLVRRSEPVNSQMPFASIDFGGRWQFVMDNMTIKDATTGAELPVNNEMRNKGKFIANFSAGTKPEHTEWGVAILALREISCLADSEPCSTAYPYVSQDYSSANDPCPNPDMDFVLDACEDIREGTGMQVDSVVCNGVTVVAYPPTCVETIGDLVNFLNLFYGAYGTWSNPEGLTIRLAGSTCSSMDLNVSCCIYAPT